MINMLVECVFMQRYLALTFKKAGRMRELSRYLIQRFETWMVHNLDFDSPPGQIAFPERVWGEHGLDYIR
jgi:hypothetical protein